VRSKIFFDELRLLKEVRSLILNEGIKLDPAHIDSLNLSSLNTLKKSWFGRPPDLDEWDELGRKLLILFPYLNDRHRITARIATAGQFMLIIPLFLLVFALFGLSESLFPEDYEWTLFGMNARNPVLGIRFSGYLLWLICLGAMGSISFVYVNALRIQVDPEVDVITLSVVAMRCILGGLFAVMLMIPFGFAGFQEFCDNLSNGKQPSNTQDALLLLIPFVIGFSSPLVMAILNKVIQTARTFFGVENAKS
jgi:hypothetical protein